jgi:nicotinamidase-related amidase
MNERPASELRLDPARAALLVVDVQARLFPAMAGGDAEGQARLLRNLLILVEAARQLALPVVWSEQYPQGLGHTVPELAAALTAPGLAAHFLEKLEFSVAAAPAFAPIADTLAARSQWIVCGMEAHVCVYQTVRDLRAAGAEVHVPADAVESRTRQNHGVGLGLAERAGAVVTSTEVVVFDLLHRAGSDAFRALSKRVR